VRLILAVETLRESDKAVMAGKKMKDDNGENEAANVLRKMMSHFCLLGKDEYGGDDGSEIHS
jgi:hypothetical protein